ncbi:MAG: amidase [Ilumatobacteraceae bacterium]|nr:amidase [Ilumatobacteraceae bacterium]
MAGEVTRRKFVELGAAGVALAASGGLMATRASAAPLTADAARRWQPWVETDITELQRLMRKGKLTSVQLTQGYLDRIDSLNPILNAVLQTNPDALRIARRLDRERWAGHVRGPLHGIPVIVKDNIATDDDMETTAGSLALLGSKVPGDAPLIRQLRKAGAIILGKANLSEWANFRGFAPVNGWTARGGFTRNPYDLGIDPCGSSSGSAASAAASLCAVAVGTETDGSVTCPSGEQSLVGMKPTVGLVSGTGIVPIAHSQDTAGPMARTVRDAALLLDVIRVPGNWVMGHHVPHSYTEFLDARSLHGARLAYDRRYVQGDFGPGDDTVTAVLDQVVEQLRQHGADVVDVESVDPSAADGNGRFPLDDEFSALLWEFKVQIAEYLATLHHSSIHTLADLIEFNIEHCADELKWYGQEIFELAEATNGDLTDPEFLAATATKQAFGKGVIDGLLDQGFDAIISHAYGYGTTPAATSGYPSMNVPVGYTPTGRPVGMLLSAGFMQEPRLFRIAYRIEQTLCARVAPTLHGTPPPDPDPFDGCAPAQSITAAVSTESAVRPAMGMHARHW